MPHTKAFVDCTGYDHVRATASTPFNFPIPLVNLNKSLWFGMIEAGKELGQPEYIHKAVKWMRVYAEQRLMIDGSS